MVLCFASLFHRRDSESGHTLSVGRAQPVVAAAAATASDGMVLPTVFEQAAAGVGVGGAGASIVQLCIVRDGEAARMGGCEEQTRLTLQVRHASRTRGKLNFLLGYSGICGESHLFCLCRCQPVSLCCCHCYCSLYQYAQTFRYQTGLT